MLDSGKHQNTFCAIYHTSLNVWLKRQDGLNGHSWSPEIIPLCVITTDDIDSVVNAARAYGHIIERELRHLVIVPCKYSDHGPTIIGGNKFEINTVFLEAYPLLSVYEI